MNTPGPETSSKSLEHYPNIEDWVEVQGGKPTFWLNQAGNNIKVVHVYDNHEDSSGRIISTPLDLRVETANLYEKIPKHMRTEASGVSSGGRQVNFPAFALISEHGDPCLTASSEIRSQKQPFKGDRFYEDQFESYKELMNTDGYSELLLIPSTSTSQTFQLLQK